MSLVDRLAVQQASASAFECPKYRPLPGSKRCQHYLDGGACALPDEFMCVEWLKANGQKVAPPAPPPVEPPPAAARPEQARDLFGAPVPPPVSKEPAKKKAEPAASPPAPPDLPAAPPLARISDEDLASFKALGVEVCIESEGIGQVWLVPEYTGKDRKEISVEHAATLRLVVDAFPGSKVTAFEKLRPAKPPTGKETS